MSIAPGLHNKASSTAVPTVIVVSSVEATTFPHETIVTTAPLAVATNQAFFNFTLSAALTSTYVVQAHAAPLIAAAKFVAAAASLAPFNTFPAVVQIEATYVNVTHAIVIASVATTVSNVIVLDVLILLDTYTLYPPNVPAYPFLNVKSAKLNHLSATV
jgi:hypothetical protein